MFQRSFEVQVLKSANDFLLKATVEKPTEAASIRTFLKLS
jgi:hypothetical protein